jgi:branched-chain amino acid transport system permease protein
MLVTVWSGLVLGAIYALVALGINISMLPSGLYNFAQGAIIVAGVYLTYSVLAVHHLGLLPLFLLNALAGVAVGVVCEIVCLRPLRRRAARAGQRNDLISTVGFSLAIVGAIGLKWGYLARAVPFVGPTKPVHLFGIFAQPDQIVLIVGAVISAVGLHVWLRRTRWGQACLAVAEDREAATLRGINVNAVTLACFAAAGAFGAVSAIAIGPITYAIPTLASTLALGGFVAIALGGRGNFLGSLGGGLLAGIASSFATRYLGANYADITVLVVLLSTLAVRPAGLGGPPSARHV